uniref:Serine and arginine rich splicing factor 4 n=1 Tax=Catharus ustulatus TaxID=91951 RepID=A0A8C3V4S4_CATUS
MPRVYIGRLSYQARERDVERFFKGYGKILEVDLKNGYGFVEFDDLRDADDAVYELNGKDLCGERVIVEHARGPRRDSSYGSGRSGYGYRRSGRDKYGPPTRTEYRLIVENLSSRCSWQDLKDYMRQAGEVTYADAHKGRKNEGVIEFKSYSDMKRALEKLDGTEVNGRKIRLVEDRPGSRRRRSYSRSRSHSRSRSRSRHSHKSRSRSASSSRSKSRSRSRSVSRSRSKSHSRSKSRSRGQKEKSRTPSKEDKSRSRSRSAEKSRNKSKDKSEVILHNSDEKAKSRSHSKEKSRSRSGSKERGEARESMRSRSKEKSRSKDREKSISKARSRSKSRDESRSRSHSKDKRKSRKRSRDDSRSRSRSRSKSEKSKRRSKRDSKGSGKKRRKDSHERSRSGSKEKEQLKSELDKKEAKGPNLFQSQGPGPIPGLGLPLGHTPSRSQGPAPDPNLDAAPLGMVGKVFCTCLVAVTK